MRHQKSRFQLISRNVRLHQLLPGHQGQIIVRSQESVLVPVVIESGAPGVRTFFIGDYKLHSPDGAFDHAVIRFIGCDSL